MATLRDVAKLANVSIATVSKIVNRVDSYVSEETRRRVEEAIEACGYVPNMVARGLKAGKTNTLGFILPDITNPFYAEITKGIETLSKEYGYSIIVCDTCINLEAEIQAVELLKAKMVDGIILGPRMFLDDEMDEKTFGETPVVIIGRMVANEEVRRNWGHISIDESKMIEESVYRLKAAGCTKIGFISARETLEEDKALRLIAFLKSMKKYQMEIKSDRIVLDEFDLETGYNGMKKLIEDQVEIDGLVCGNDLIAVGALNAARDCNISVPNQLKIIGLDGIQLSRYTNPRLSTIAQPAYLMGEEAAKMLISHIEKKTKLSIKFFNHTYIERETV